MINRPRGTFDILPDASPAWELIFGAARRVSRRLGYAEIRTPTFEATELFSRGVGETTDIVNKEMYTFEDREGRSFTLRPEGTAGIARAIIENGLIGGAMPLRLFYLLNCFRYEKPQAGRSREFWQYGAELYGAPTPYADAEIISLASFFLDELGISGAELNLNSIGCPKCRPAYRDALKAYFSAHIVELCDTCKERLEKNPLRILDCKSPICKAIADGAPKTIDHLCSDCKGHMDTLTGILEQMNVKFVVNPRIVRGLDYYTRTVFEFISPNIGAQSTICGGGRYDGLTEQLGGPAVSGIGFAMGITRLLLELEAADKLPTAENSPTLYIASLGEAAARFAAVKTAGLREKGITCESDIVGRSLKAQMKYADKIGARYVVVIGDSELAANRAKLRDMKSSEEREIALDGEWERQITEDGRLWS